MDEPDRLEMCAVVEEPVGAAVQLADGVGRSQDRGVGEPRLLDPPEVTGARQFEHGIQRVRALPGHRDAVGADRIGTQVGALARTRRSV